MSREERLPIVCSSDTEIPITSRQKRFKKKSHDQIGKTVNSCDNYGFFGICNPRSRMHRFVALAFMCLLGFGVLFCYDNPAALQDVFRRELDISATQFTFVYSIYSWPNVVLCFIGGFLVDRIFGIRVGTVIFMIVLLIGQVVFACGALYNKFWILILGRFIFGIGAESLAVAQNNYAVLWFKGKELNMVFGLQLSVARLGSSVNFWVLLPIYRYVSQFYEGNVAVGVVLLLSSGTCVLSLLFAVILGWMDEHEERVTQRNKNYTPKLARLSDVLTFNMTFWLLSIVVVSYYVAVFPFIALGQSFFINKFNITSEQANDINSIVYLISALVAPLFGFIIDKTGRNVSWVFLATLTTLLAHAVLTFTALNPYFGVITMGLSYSMVASSLWPIVSLIVPEYQLGTAYGFCQSVQNLGLAVMTIVAGIIVDKSGGNHYWVELFFMAWLLVALAATIAIMIYDSNQKGNLNMSPKERDAFQDAILAVDEQHHNKIASDQDPLLHNDDDDDDNH